MYTGALQPKHCTLNSHNKMVPTLFAIHQDYLIDFWAYHRSKILQSGSLCSEELDCMYLPRNGISSANQLQKMNCEQLKDHEPEFGIYAVYVNSVLLC